jgi:hypothetical protein
MWITRDTLPFTPDRTLYSIWSVRPVRGNGDWWPKGSCLPLYLDEDQSKALNLTLEPGEIRKLKGLILCPRRPRKTK